MPAGITFTNYSDHNGASPQFTLTCISTGGPATTVSWTRDSATVMGNEITVLDNAVTAQYTHTLTVTGRTEGLYRCSVSNSKPSSVAAEIDVTGTVYPILNIVKYSISMYIISSNAPPAPSPPSHLSVSQNGPNSALVCWTAPLGEPAVTGYIIYYQQQNGGERLSVNTNNTTTNITITELNERATYSITMVATSSTIPSTETAALTVTVGTGLPLFQRCRILCNIISSTVRQFCVVLLAVQVDNIVTIGI